MKSQTVQEFKSVPFRGALQPSAGSFVTWSSPNLNTMFPMEGRPAGSDRAVCHTVNGFLSVSFKDKSILSSTAKITAGLWGEFSGVQGLIASTSLSFADTASVQGFFQSGGALAFNQWSSFANLAQSIFIKVTIFRTDTALAEVPIDAVFSGSLVGSDVRF